MHRLFHTQPDYTSILLIDLFLKLKVFDFKFFDWLFECLNFPEELFFELVGVLACVDGVDGDGDFFDVLVVVGSSFRPFQIVDFSSQLLDHKVLLILFFLTILLLLFLTPIHLLSVRSNQQILTLTQHQLHLPDPFLIHDIFFNDAFHLGAILFNKTFQLAGLLGKGGDDSVFLGELGLEVGDGEG